MAAVSSLAGMTGASVLTRLIAPLSLVLADCAHHPGRLLFLRDRRVSTASAGSSGKSPVSIVQLVAARSAYGRPTPTDSAAPVGPVR
jgi:hypothetical protein